MWSWISLITLSLIFHVGCKYRNQLGLAQGKGKNHCNLYYFSMKLKDKNSDHSRKKLHHGVEKLKTLKNCGNPRPQIYVILPCPIQTGNFFLSKVSNCYCFLYMDSIFAFFSYHLWPFISHLMLLYFSSSKIFISVSVSVVLNEGTRVIPLRSDPFSLVNQLWPEKPQYTKSSFETSTR